MLACAAMVGLFADPGAGQSAATGSIAGTVTDPSGGPVVATCVQARSATDPAGPVRTADTGGDGSYLLTDLPPDEYLVEFNCRDDEPYLAEYFDDAFSRNAAARLRVDGTSLAGIDAVLGPGGSLSGRVTGPSGEGVGGVWVNLFADWEPGGLAATTAPDGTWRIDGAPPGRWPLLFDPSFLGPEHRTLVTEWFDGARREEDGTLVTVVDSQETAGLDAALEVGGRVAGRITDADTGEPVPGCRYDLWDAEWRPPGWPYDRESGADGRYEVVGLPGGDYVAVLGCTGTYQLPVETDPPSVQVVEGATVALDGEVREGGIVAGRVVDADTGAGLDGCTIYVHREDGTVVASTGTGSGANGAYRTGPVPAGDQRVAAFGCVGGYERGFHPAAATPSGATAVTVEPGEDTAGVVIALRRSPGPGFARDVANTCPAGTPSGGFRDVPPEHTHAAAIDCAAWWELVLGSDGRFRPDDTVTRGQLASLAVRLTERTAGPVPDGSVDRFPDDDGSVHERAINGLAGLGLLAGRADGTFGPELPITRGQLARVLAGVIEYQRELPVRSARSWYTDDDGSVHEAQIDGLTEIGVLAGRGAGTFGPDDPLSRGQAATALVRSLDTVVDAGLGWPPPPS